MDTHTQLDARYYEQLLEHHNKVAVAARCGWGKTRAAVEFIAKHYHNGVVYVAERREQIQDMRKQLLEHGVPDEMIGLYYSSSTDQKALQETGVNKHIALMTHARIQAYPPHKYVMLHKHGGLHQRQVMIIDESVTPLIMLKAPKLFVEGFLRRMGLSFDDTGKLDPDDIDKKIAGVSDLIDQHARYPMATHAGVRYLDWEASFPDCDAVVEVRQHAYYLMLYQILAGNYIARTQDIDVILPMAPHQMWVNLFEKVLILDATAEVTDFLYTDYTIVNPGAWNFSDITIPYKIQSGIGSVSKTNMRQHKEAFLDEIRTVLPKHFENFDFYNPYIVTYKAFRDEVEDILHFPVQYYGLTRGSNNFRETDSAVLIGAFRPPVEFDQLARMVFRETYSPYKIAVAHWLQETYRTRIREGKSIKLIVIGEKKAVKQLRDTLDIVIYPVCIGYDNDPEVRERILKSLKSRVGKTLLGALIDERCINKRMFARDHTNYDMSKVDRALRGILDRHPALEDHIEADATHIRLVDKPVPL